MSRSECSDTNRKTPNWCRPQSCCLGRENVKSSALFFHGGKASIYRLGQGCSSKNILLRQSLLHKKSINQSSNNTNYIEFRVRVGYLCGLQRQNAGSVLCRNFQTLHSLWRDVSNQWRRRCLRQRISRSECRRGWRVLLNRRIWLLYRNLDIDSDVRIYLRSFWRLLLR